MIATRGLGAGLGATLPTLGMGAGYGGAAPPTPTPSGSKGRRLARWVINAPWIVSPVADWVRQRDDDEILLLG
jgi:hypothetical protein